MDDTDTVDTAPQANRLTRIRVWTLVSLVVVVGAAAMLYWTVFSDDRPHAEVGSRTLAERGAVHGSTADVYVPWGRFSVTIGDPTEELPETLRDEKQAPDDGRFVGLATEIGKMDSLLPMAFTQDGRYREPRVTLVADGKRYPVPELTKWMVTHSGNLRVQFRRDVFVAVAGNPEKLWLEVTYDGATQKVTSSGKVAPGRFAALKGVKKGPNPIPCGKTHGPAQYSEAIESAKCKLTRVGRLPYVAGLGWADKGHEWLVILAEFEPPDFDEVDFELASDDARSSYSLDGKQPAAKARANTVGPPLTFSDPDDPDQVIFSVPKGSHDMRLEISRTYRKYKVGPSLPLSWHVKLP